jgi:tRNA(Ile)-lysidine synthase
MQSHGCAELLRQALQPHLAAGAHYAVALSGGGDSVALLHVLVTLRAMGGFTLHALHFNHQLRGVESDADEQFCRGICAAWDVPFEAGRADVRAHAQVYGLSLEDAARQCRFQWLAHAAQTCGATAVLLAHHADDQAETVLLRLLRGAGIHGLAGMKVTTTFHDMTFVRPLLHMRQHVLIAYAAQCGLTHRHDRSNDDTRHTRNWLRHEIMPRLAARMGEACTERICHTADVAREIDDVLEQRAAALRAQHGRRSCLGELFPAAALRAVPIAEQRAVLRQIVAELGKPNSPVLDFDMVERLRQAALAGAGQADFTLPAPLVAGCAYDHLFVTDRPAPVAAPLVLQAGMPRAWPCGMTIARHPAPARGVSLSDNGEAWRAAALGEPVTMRQFCALPPDTAVHVRPRRAGERYQPVHGHAHKIKDLLIAAGVPRYLKEIVPVVECDGQLVWLAGWRIAAAFAVRAETPVTMLEVVCR